MDRVAITIPKANGDGGAVEVNADGDVHVEVTEEAVNVTVDDGHEEVAVSVNTENAGPVVENSVDIVGDVLGEVDRIVSEDEVLNQVVNDTMEELVNEAYDEIADEVFDEIFDEGLGGLFGLFH